jgi:hypothetical protein
LEIATHVNYNPIVRSLRRYLVLLLATWVLCSTNRAAAQPSEPKFAPPAQAEPQTPRDPPSQAPAPLGALSLASPPVASPPPPHPFHEGFYLRFSSGFGYVRVWGNGPSGSAGISSFGFSSTFSIGGALAPGLALAATLRFARGKAHFHGGPFEHARIVGIYGDALGPVSDYADAGMVELGALVDWYPKARGGWHVGGTVGPGGVTLTDRANDADSANVALAGSVFGGYDWRVDPSWSAGLMLVGSAASRAAMKNTDQNQTGYRLQPLALMLEFDILIF